MGIKASYHSKGEGFPEMIKRLKAVDGTAIEVGVLKGEHKWLASIHEYGCDIKPGKAEYLTVPLVPEAVGRRAGSFKDTFVYTSKSGKKFIAQKSGNDLKLLYWLTKSVKIPERAFLRGGYDANVDKVRKKAAKMLADVASGAMTADALHEGVGLELAGKIQEYAVNLDSPPKSSITISALGTSNPLIDSGDMIGSITWRKAK